MLKVVLWSPFGDLGNFGLVYVLTVCIGMVLSMTASYFLSLEIRLSAAKPRIQSSATVFFDSFRWLCILISALHPRKGLGSCGKPSEFLIFSTHCCFTKVTCNWLLQGFASIDWARYLFAPCGFLGVRTCCCFMIVTCDWMSWNLFSHLWVDALFPLMVFFCSYFYLDSVLRYSPLMGLLCWAYC